MIVDDLVAEPVVNAGMASKMILASFEFAHGTLLFHRSGSKTRRCRSRRQGLARWIRGGLEPLEATLEEFSHDTLTRDNHTLKRALTDPHLFSGIGNAYSDEILHAARLSPFKQTMTLTDDEIARLPRCDVTVLTGLPRLREEPAADFRRR